MTRDSESPARLSADELFRVHAPFVARFLVQLGVSREDLDDVLQEVFLVVHARGGYVAGPAKPTSYLGSIAVRAAHAHRRRATAQRARDGGDDTDALATSAPDADERIASDQQSVHIQRALAQLPDDLRAVLLLVELEGESCTSVAASMQCPVGTIYWRLHNAKKQFRRALACEEARAQVPTGHVRNGWGS
jgi:RNA polymerase sigma-70 factor (ECF subfamily)